MEWKVFFFSPFTIIFNQAEKNYFSSGILSSLASVPLALPLFPASAAKFCEENDETTLDLADPKADPIEVIFWLAEMKLCELEMEDQTEAVLVLAASRASPVFL